MVTKSSSRARLTHGHPIPDHLNPAKQPGGALKNDHEAGPSRTAHRPPGQDAPVTPQNRTPSPREERDSGASAVQTPAVRNGGGQRQDPPGRTLRDFPERQDHPGMTLGEFLARPFTPSDAGSPQAPRRDSQAGSAVPRQNPGAGADPSSPAASHDSEDSDLAFALIGNPRRWLDPDATVEKMKAEDARLDKIPFIAAFLDPKKKSPEHGKSHWNKLPTDHPLFADYLITEHPEYYRFRTERRNSMTGQDVPHPAPERPDRPRRAQSLPSRFPATALPTLAALTRIPGPEAETTLPRLGELIPLTEFALAEARLVPAEAEDAIGRAAAPRIPEQAADATGRPAAPRIPGEAAEAVGQAVPSPVPGEAADPMGHAHPDDARPNDAAARAEHGQANATHADADPNGTDCTVSPSTYKAYLAGAVGIGVGLVGGIIIASALDGSSTNGSGNT